MNELPEPLLKGTFGELLVQLRLFLHSVQSAAPIKDTGNDLIAIRSTVFRAVQVKTTDKFPVEFVKAELPVHYHVLAIVVLGKVDYDNLVDFDVNLDSCRVYLLAQDQVTKGYYTEEELTPFEITVKRVDKLWPRPL
jgi:hypothetical protein